MSAKKIIIVVLRILLALLVAVIIWLFVDTMSSASGQIVDQQETCPDGVDGWIKIEPLSGYEYTYTAPEGFLVAETCSKAGTTVEYNVIDPPQNTVTIVSNVQQELSHVAVRLIEDPSDPTETSIPTVTQTPTPTAIVTITQTPDLRITPSPTATSQVTATPTTFFELDTTADEPSGGVGPNFSTALAFILAVGLIASLIVIRKGK